MLVLGSTGSSFCGVKGIVVVRFSCCGVALVLFVCGGLW